jgi:integrase
MRVIGRLTINKTKNAKPRPNGKASLLCDGGGLWLQVSAGKGGQINKSWLFRYAAPGTKISRTGREYRRERVMGLGPLHTVGLADAREAAREARLALRAGKDPIEQKHASRTAARAVRINRQTFAEAAGAYLVKHGDSWKSEHHRLQWRNTLRDYMLPVLGQMDVEAVDTDAVLRVLDPIWTAIPETASRVRGRIQVVLDFAGRTGNNPARWKGHLEHKFPGRNKARTVEHLPALPYTEVATFMAELRGVDSIAARALELTILCATRTGETLYSTWAEFDIAKRLWTIPAVRTKRDRELVVPLSDAAVAVVEAMAAVRHDSRVFPVSEPSMRLCLQDIRQSVTVHGFRATFRSWAGGCTTHPRDVCEQALGHAIGDAVEQAYQRDSLLAKRRVLMSDWADFCGNPAASVLRVDVSMRRAAAKNKEDSMRVEGRYVRNTEVSG